jgi:hypothetical protein
MRQLKKLGQGTLPAQGFNDAKTNAAAAVNRNTLRLVNHEQRLVFVDDGQINTLLGYFIHFILWSLGDADGRNTQFIASAKTVSCIDPPAIYPHFSTTQNTVKMALGNTLATANEEVIKTLALLFFSDHHMGDGIVTSTIHFLIYCPRFASRFARDSEPSDRSPSRYKRDRQTAGSEVSLARLAQARPT